MKLRTAAFALTIFIGCGGEQTLPKGTGASGTASENAAKPSDVQIPDEIANAKPGSGMGVGGGDGMGRIRNPETAGKAHHGRGGGKKKGMKSADDKTNESKEQPATKDTAKSDAK